MRFRGRQMETTVPEGFDLFVKSFWRTYHAFLSASDVEKANGEKDQLFPHLGLFDDTNEPTQLQRDRFFRWDDSLAKSGKEVCSTAIKRNGGDRSGLDEENSKLTKF
jgi:hypothetical protein